MSTPRGAARVARRPGATPAERAGLNPLTGQRFPTARGRGRGTTRTNVRRAAAQ